MELTTIRKMKIILSSAKFEQENINENKKLLKQFYIDQKKEEEC
jgi:hypothetical protein